MFKFKLLLCKEEETIGVIERDKAPAGIIKYQDKYYYRAQELSKVTTENGVTVIHNVFFQRELEEIS